MGNSSVTPQNSPTPDYLLVISFPVMDSLGCLEIIKTKGWSRSIQDSRESSSRDTS